MKLLPSKAASKATLSVFLLGGLMLGATAPDISAAPVLDAQDQKVVNRLTWLLNRRVKQPNGQKISIVITPTARASEGYFAEIKMKGAPAQLKKQLQVSEFALDAKNVRLDVDSLWNGNRVKTYQSQTTLRAVITENDLTTMLARGKTTGSMNLKVKFMGDRLGVTGNLNYLLLNGPVAGVGKLRMAAGHKVYLDILSLKLRGVEVPAFVKNQFSNRLNPLIDTSDLPFNPPFKGVTVVGNKAILTT